MALTQVPSSMLANSGAELGMRNRIINGDMRIDQRNAGASVTINSSATNSFSVDRWQAAGETTDGVFTLQQVTTAPAGFVNSIKATVTTADASIGSAQRYFIQQRIEGNNVADLGWGAAGAQSITLSFWVRSSLTGTFGGSLRNSAGTRSYPFTYTISAADTWEQKSITITGDTTGTWLTDTGIGVFVTWGLGVGSTLTAAGGAWTAGGYWSANSVVNVIGTLNATFYITGVQFEVGSNATPFERRLYGQELALCQRYYEKSYAQGTTPGTITNAGRICLALGAVQGSVTYNTTQFKITKRTSPTVTIYSVNAGTAGYVSQDAGADVAATVNQAVDSGFDVGWTNGASRFGGFYQFAATAEL